MSFLPDVKVLCDACRGQRFGTETMAVQLRGKSVGEVLSMSVDEAVEFFTAHPSTHHALRLLQDVGLGYLTLARQSGTLSGGESQRIRLASQIGSGLTGVLYVLDEPSIGLHQRDNDRLLKTLVRLRDIGSVEDGQAEMRTAAFFNGKPAVLLTVTKQSGQNTVTVAAELKRQIGRAHV